MPDPETGLSDRDREVLDVTFNHIRYDASRSTDESWNDAGLSSARFDLPDSKKVIIGGGSMGADPHYCVRIIRIDVKESL